jgi:hypothetical protein
VGRAVRVERELGIPDGAFAHRPAAWLTFGVWPVSWPVNHRRPVTTIYVATAASWIFLVLEAMGMALAEPTPAVGSCNGSTAPAVLPQDLHGTAARWALASLALAVAVATAWVLAAINKQLDARTANANAALSRLSQLTKVLSNILTAIKILDRTRQHYCRHTEGVRLGSR